MSTGSLEDVLFLMKSNVQSVGESSEYFINVLSSQLPYLESLLLEIQNSGVCGQANDVVKAKISTIKRNLEAAISEIQEVHRLLDSQCQNSLTAYYLSI